MRILYLALAILPGAAVACDGAGARDSLVGPGGTGPVAAVVVSPSSATVAVGGVAQLSAVAVDRDGNTVTDAQIAWGSTDLEVADVSPSGRVTARKAGNSRIRASSGGIEGSATVDVVDDAGAAVATVTVALGASALVVGQGTQATATLRDQSGAVLGGRAVTWTSSNTGVATVGGDGYVSAVSAGSATITATSEGKSGSATLAVSDPAATPVASVSVSPGAGVVETGKTLQLTATPRDASGNPLTGRTVTWASSSETVATVSTSGLVTGVTVGTVTVTASSEGKTGSATVQVSPAPPPEVVSVLITPESATIDALNQSLQLSVTAKDASGNTVPGVSFLWRSVNTAIATVGTSGNVTSKGVGTVLIIAAAGLIADTASVTVRQVPATIAVSPTSATVTVGSTRQLQPIIRDAGGSSIPGVSVSWSSSASSIASVSSSGLVTGVAVGSAAITASASGLSASASITVAEAPPPPPPSEGIWISQNEIMALPMSGSAWTNLKAKADGSCGTPALSNQDSPGNTCIMAKALVFARTGTTSYRDTVVEALRYIANSGTYSGRALALGRELAAFVIAADLVGLPSYDPALDQDFRAKLIELRTTYTNSGPDNIIKCHEVRPNNWGTVCGATRAAIAAYLDDQAELDRTAQVFKGWLGDRSAYAGFVFQETSGQDARTWSPTPTALVAVNPKGATVTWNGASYNVDGALVDDMSRGCATFQWPPCETDYAWEGLAGAIVQAEILHRRGYPAYEWQDQAIRRAYEYLWWLHQETGGFWWDEGTVIGDDNWQPWIVNMRYGLSLPTRTPTRPGKGMGWSDWTHVR